MQRLLPLLRSFFIFLWIFSIPTSLAWHYNKSQGLVNGILVDYRIPQISLSSILLLLCLIILLFERSREQKQSSFRTYIHSKISQLQKVFLFSLTATFLFQTSLALFQFRFQQSLFGYFPFGEVNLKDLTISKGVFFDGYLYKLPYGTTVHPNILAGFCVVTFLLLLSQKHTLFVGTKLLSLLFFLTAVICFITQSLSATLALIFGLCVWSINTKENLLLERLQKIAIITLPILSFCIFLSPITYRLSPTFSRRFQLQNMAIMMITENPLFGVGWNNFTVEMENYGYVSGSIRFLQPVHNVFVLLIAELGTLGWILCTALAKLILRSSTRPLVLVGPLVLIASLDHYLLTLTTGRMMVILVIVVLYLFGQDAPNHDKITRKR